MLGSMWLPALSVDPLACNLLLLICKQTGAITEMGILAFSAAREFQIATELQRYDVPMLRLAPDRK